MPEGRTKHDKPIFIHIGNRTYILDYTEEKQDGTHAYASKRYVEMPSEDPTKYNKSNRLDNFDAKEARRLSEKSGINELQIVLQEIKRVAETSANSLYYEKLGNSTIRELEKRGFIVGISQYSPRKYLITW